MHTHCTVYPHTAAAHCCCSYCTHICQLNTRLLTIADSAVAAAADTAEGVHRTPSAGPRTAAAAVGTAAGAAAAAVRCTAAEVVRTHQAVGEGHRRP
jgi:hypothetical protein